MNELLEKIFARLKEHSVQGRLDSDVMWMISKYRNQLPTSPTSEELRRDAEEQNVTSLVETDLSTDD